MFHVKLFPTGISMFHVKQSGEQQVHIRDLKPLL